MAIDTRTEHDSMGQIDVPAERLWGAQTERSRRHFEIGVDRFRFTRPVVRALGLVKKCAALANRDLGQLPPETADLIVRAADEVAVWVSGQLELAQLDASRTELMEAEVRALRA